MAGSIEGPQVIPWDALPIILMALAIVFIPKAGDRW